MLKVYKDKDGYGTCSYWNYTKPETEGMNILRCSQMPDYREVNVNSMFLEARFNQTAYEKWCELHYGITPDYDWMWDTFGGAGDVTAEYANYTNIMFNNGDLDPWGVSGVDCGLPDTYCGQ